MADHKIVMRNILEIRLKEKLFHFLDYRGEFIDFLINKYNCKKIKYLNNGSRIDVATDDLKEILFFGVDNFGFQIEAIENFKSIRAQILKIFKILEKFEKYKFKNIIRIGIKSTIYYHKKGIGFEAIQDKYRKKMFKDCNLYEKITSSRVVDFGYSFNDVEMTNSKARILTGPMNKEEAVNKFFSGSDSYNDAKKAGIIYEIDCFKNDPQENLKNDEIKNIALKNVDDMEKSFNGFKEFIFKKSEKEN